MVHKQSSVCAGKKSIELIFTQNTKINLRWIIALNVKAEIIKLLEKHTGDISAT